MKRNIVVTGATGNVGSKLAEMLLAKGHTVTAVVRNAEKAAHLKQLGATLAVGDMHDPAFLASVYTNKDAAFVMNPPAYAADDYLAEEAKLTASHVAAINKSGLKNVVVLSSLGADKNAGTGPIIALHRLEQAIGEIAHVNAVFLRPGYFLENLRNNIGMAQLMNINGAPAKADRSFGVIACTDIAEYAASILEGLTFTGKTVKELVGPKDVTWTELTAALGNALGKPNLPYVQFTPEQAYEGMVQAGLGKSISGLFVEMYAGMDSGLVTYNRANAVIGKTTVEAFLKELVATA